MIGVIRGRYPTAPGPKPRPKLGPKGGRGPKNGRGGTLDTIWPTGK